MKKLVLLLSLALTACATTQQVPPTPAQLVQQFCPVVKTLNSELTIVSNVSASVVDFVKQASPITDAVCATGATINATNLQTLLDTGLPLLLKVAADTAISSTPQGQALLVAIPIAQVLIPQIIATLPKQ